MSFNENRSSRKKFLEELFQLIQSAPEGADFLFIASCPDGNTKDKELKMVVHIEEEDQTPDTVPEYLLDILEQTAEMIDEQENIPSEVVATPSTSDTDLDDDQPYLDRTPRH